MLCRKYMGPGYTTTCNNLYYDHMMILNYIDQKYHMLHLFTYVLLTMIKYYVMKMHGNLIGK